MLRRTLAALAALAALTCGTTAAPKQRPVMSDGSVRFVGSSPVLAPHVLHFTVKRRGNTRYFNGYVSRSSAGSPMGSTLPLGQVRFRVDSQTQASAAHGPRPSLLLQRLAVPRSSAPVGQAGRITSIAVDPSDPLAPRDLQFRARPTDTSMGPASGGAWKTMDGGRTWIGMRRGLGLRMR
jgi:hypothetical protein